MSWKLRSDKSALGLYKILVVVVLCAIANAAVAQKLPKTGAANLEIIEPETIKTSWLEKLDNIHSGSLDTLKDPKCYLISDDLSVTVAIPTGNGFHTFEIADNGLALNFSKYQTMDFDGKGSKELILFFQFSHGNSSHDHGMGERYESFFVIDLDAPQIYIYEEYCSFRHDWYLKGDSTITSMECICSRLEVADQRILLHAVDENGLDINVAPIRYYFEDGQTNKSY